MQQSPFPDAPDISSSVTSATRGPRACGTIPIDAMDSAALTDYAGVVGHLPAKGRARTSGASMISGYMGRSDWVVHSLATSRSAALRPQRGCRRDYVFVEADASDLTGATIDINGGSHIQ